MYANAKTKNSGNDEGNVASWFENLVNLIQRNDGTRTFEPLTEDCHDVSAPFNQGQETMIKITNQNHHITQIEDNFLTFEVELTVQLATPITTGFTDTDKVCKVFVGFKNSTEILSQLQVICNGKSIGIQDNECLREGFAYQTVMPRVAKKSRFDHSLWEKVSQFSPAVAGTYINLSDLISGNPLIVRFEMNLPVTHIMALQALQLYPNFCLGELELKFYVRQDGLVWAPIYPRVVYEYNCLMSSTATTTEFPDVIPITRAFRQIGNASKIINTFTITSGGASLTVTENRLICTNMRILRLKSTINGFGVVPSSLKRIESFFAEPRYIPSQQLDYYAFPHAPNTNGFQSSINIPLFNANQITFIFPKYGNDRTCYENIMYQNLQATINGKNYPDEPVQTLGARFLKYQLIASELDGPIEATYEYEESLIEPKNDLDATTKTRYDLSRSDNTSFMFNVQLERSNAGYCFDGLDSNGVNDTYYNVDAAGTIHPPPPECWVIVIVHHAAKNWH
jgi:hypothetical protein